MKDRLILTRQFQDHPSKVVLHFRRQHARNIHRMLEKLGHGSTIAQPPSRRYIRHNALSVDLQWPACCAAKRSMAE